MNRSGSTIWRSTDWNFADLDVSFFLRASIRVAKSGRAIAIGEFQGRVIVAVVFLPMRREAISIISMRPASRKERSEI